MPLVDIAALASPPLLQARQSGFDRLISDFDRRCTMKYSTGTAIRLMSNEATSPAIQEMANPWKIGSARITAAPTITAAAVSTMGRNRTAPASITA